MSLANFFDRAAVAASAVLRGFDSAEFGKSLQSRKVGIQYDKNAVFTFEGRETLQLLINLLSRLYLRNCTFSGGGLCLTPWDVQPDLLVEDCSFDSTGGITQDNYGFNGVYDYNAYTDGYQHVTTNTDLTPSGIHDTNLAAFNWQPGSAGNFYLPTNSPLINLGSRSAPDAGLYQFTTQTNQMKETNTMVDFGYHYVALGNDGEPLDTDGDGIPDYLEDANGNGVVDSGETDWQDAADMGLKVWITDPKDGAVLP